MNTSEEQELLSKIGEISGRINRFKNLSSSGQQSDVSWNKYTSPSVLAAHKGARVVQHGKTSGGPPRPSGHRHRTLVVKSSGHTSSTDDERSQQPNTSWVTKRDRHMQLINTNILDKTTQARSKAMEQTRQQKASRRDQREKQKIHKFLQDERSLRAQATMQPTAHEVTVNGLRFRILNNGSKLFRMRGEFDGNLSTPKQATVGGVTFMRSKNGNLYRSGIAKATKAAGVTRKINTLCKRFTLTGNSHSSLNKSHKKLQARLLKENVLRRVRATLTISFNLGQCGKGPHCPYIHDPSKVAMCRDFLQTGACPAGGSCDLSHDPIPERVPTCLHFLRGKCSNSPCRYAHVRVQPSAPVCRDFAILGYCGKGAHCSERHVRECPDYANNGICRNTKCRLSHVDRAGQIRKHKAPAQGSELAVNDDDDVVSDEEEESDSDDMDSDGLEEILGQELSEDATSHALSQQQDFVGF